MAKTSNHYVLILCGGSGPRLWPLSRASNPKQFLSLFTDKSLIQETYSRYQKIVPTSNIFIVSNVKYKSAIAKQLKTLPKNNLIIEPEKKNTAMAIVYGSSIISRLNPKAIITSAPADHFITNIKAFTSDISQAVKTATTNDKIVTIGITPTYPNPSFGYILSNSKFVEKPSLTDAQLYIKKGAQWNSGIYTFSLHTLSQELKTHQPDYYSYYQKLITNPRSVNSLFKQSANLSFDVAISEKSSSLVNISSHFDWSDIGEWKSIWDKLTKNKDGLATISKQTIYTSFNSKNCLIHGIKNKLVGLVGLNNLAIIDTSDSLLVCNLNDSFSVRDLISQIVASPKLKKFFLN